MDPKFVEIGDTFLTEQEKEFGSNHIYSVDPFNELLPPNRFVKQLFYTIRIVGIQIIKLKSIGST